MSLPTSPSIFQSIRVFSNEGKIEGGRRRGQQRMRWLDGITDSMDMSLSKLSELVRKGRPGCCSPWGPKSRTQLSNSTELPLLSCECRNVTQPSLFCPRTSAPAVCSSRIFPQIVSGLPCLPIKDPLLFLQSTGHSAIVYFLHSLSGSPCTQCRVLISILTCGCILCT